MSQSVSFAIRPDVQTAIRLSTRMRFGDSNKRAVRKFYLPNLPNLIVFMKANFLTLYYTLNG